MRTIPGWVVLLFLVAYVWPADAQSKGTIKIATQSPLSGGQAVLGEGIKLGAQLAVEKMKGNLEKMGYKVDFVPFDDQAKPDVGVANAKNIIADKDIMAIIGHLNSGVAIPSSEVYKEVGLAMILPAVTHPRLTEGGYVNVARVCGRDDTQGVGAATFAANTLKVRSVYVVHDMTPYGQGLSVLFKAAAEKNGSKVLGFEGTQLGADFDSLLMPIRNKNPDLIYFAGNYEQGAPFFKEARLKGLSSILLGSNGIDTPQLRELAGKAAVGMYYSTVAAPVSTVRSFAEDFRKKFNKSATPYAAEAYDAAGVALKAIELTVQKTGGLKRENVAMTVRTVKFDGITGPIAFNSNGDRKMATVWIVQVAEPGQDNKLIASIGVDQTQGPGVTPTCPAGQKWCKKQNACINNDSSC
jgi:branched-chain amino acid transport system substrate-binding protein